jgi:hypothetical protein
VVLWDFLPNKTSSKNLDFCHKSHWAILVSIINIEKADFAFPFRNRCIMCINQKKPIEIE